MGSQPSVSLETVDELFKVLSVLTRAVEQILETRAVESAIDESLSASKVQVLRLLNHRGDQTASQIAYFLGVTKPAVSQIIDSLARSQLVVRRPATHDRREVNVKLTGDGKGKFQALRREQRHLLRTAIRLSDKANVEVWIKTLREIANAVARADRTFKQFCLRCGAHADESCVLLGGDANCLFLQHHEASHSKRPVRKTPKR